MKERPILFSGAMVRAILRGEKTQTRRLVTARNKDQRVWLSDEAIGRVARFEHRKDAWWAMAVGEPSRIVHCGVEMDGGHIGSVQCPCGAVGDRLWVRETWAYFGGDEYLYQHDVGSVSYRADEIDDWANNPPCGRWRPSIHMPRWASRITLEITDVRVERLQAISEEDALAEGFDPWPKGKCKTARGNFAVIWTSINGKSAAWDLNPWVWAISFKRVEP